MKKESNTGKASDNAVLTLIASLDHFHPVDESVKDFLKKNTYPCSFPKGKLLLHTGDISEHIYFIEKGAVRGFIRDGKKDITTWITAENELVTSISALSRRAPSPENMQAIEDCKMLAITYSDLQKLYEIAPEFNIVVRKLLQEYYRDAEGRAFIARLASAETKYKQFLLRYGHLANRIPLKHIASFLGITLETLSRVRKKISRQKN